MSNIVHLTDEEFRNGTGEDVWTTAPEGTVLIVAPRPLNRAERRAGTARRSDYPMVFKRDAEGWSTSD